MKRIASFLFILLLPISVFAQEPAASAPSESREEQAVVQRILEERGEDGVRQMRFEAKTDAGETFVVDTSSSYTEGLRYAVRPGDRVILALFPNTEGGYDAQIADVVRTGGLALVFALFALLTVAVGFLRGFSSLLGLGVTLAILFAVVFPRILDGADPVLTIALGGAAILAVNMHLSHGFNRRTFVAFASTLVALGLAVVFAELFVAWGRLSGLASEESVFLYWQVGNATLDPRGILLAGIILGAVGVLDDIAVTQGETVAELKDANPGLSPNELFARAMRVGRHHIASTVNTLVLAYAGASLPLFLLFLNSSVSMRAFMNTELVAEEIVRTLAGTAALVLSVPISTLLAARFATSESPVHNRLDGEGSAR